MSDIKIGDKVLCIKDTFKSESYGVLRKISNLKEGDEYVITSMKLCSCGKISVTVQNVIYTGYDNRPINMFCTCGLIADERVKIGDLLPVSINRFVKADAAQEVIEEVNQILNPAKV